METLYSFPGTGQNSLGAVADIIIVLPFLLSVLFVGLTLLRKINTQTKGKDIYPLVVRYYHNIVK